MSTTRARTVWIDHCSELPARTETVFELLARIEDWPRWVPGLTFVRRFRTGPLEPGETFLMAARVHCAWLTVVPCTLWRYQPDLIAWGGGFAGAVVHHSFAIEGSSTTTSQVRHVEYATGWLARPAAPMAELAHRFDMRWSRALEQQFSSPAQP